MMISLGDEHNRYVCNARSANDHRHQCKYSYIPHRRKHKTKRAADVQSKGPLVEFFVIVFSCIAYSWLLTVYLSFQICMDEEVNIVLLPCGHLVSCVKCTPALRYCPICRNGIKGTVRTFMVWKETYDNNSKRLESWMIERKSSQS